MGWLPLSSSSLCESGVHQGPRPTASSKALLTPKTNSAVLRTHSPRRAVCCALGVHPDRERGAGTRARTRNTCGRRAFARSLACSEEREKERKEKWGKGEKQFSKKKGKTSHTKLIRDCHCSNKKGGGEK